MLDIYCTVSDVAFVGKVGTHGVCTDTVELAYAEIRMIEVVL